MRGYEDSKVPRLFELMEQRNVKATELSNETGITKGSITDWKRGKSVPTGQRLITLCNYFGVTAEYLLRTDDSNTPEKLETESTENTQILSEDKKLLIEISQLDESEKEHVKSYIKFLTNQKKA